MSETTDSLVRAEPEILTAAEKFQVQFADWTGPYDLLLQVIDEQGLNLLDLDIAVLLDHYLDYLNTHPTLNLDEAGEFLVVAATLAQIKSKLLLPKDEREEEEQEKDPREDLVRYLMEYQKIKQAAELLKDRPLLGRDVFLKGFREHFEGLEGEGRGNLFQLVKGFQKAIREFKAEQPFEIAREEISVADRLQQIFHQLKEEKEVEFNVLLEGARSKVFLIATFLSVLELVRLKKVKIRVEGGLALRMVEGATEEDIVESEFDQVLLGDEVDATAESAPVAS